MTGVREIKKEKLNYFSKSLAVNVRVEGSGSMGISPGRVFLGLCFHPERKEAVERGKEGIFERNKL